MKRLAALALVVLAGCPAHRATLPVPETGGLPPQPNAPAITWQRVESITNVSSTPPPAGTYRIHMIDVGTGLSLLVQGHDWNLLYDAGSNDSAEKPLRVVAYLERALGPSGDESCVEPGQEAPAQRLHIDHVVLSHPHFDHGSALELVLHCYDVTNVWDSGSINQAAFYRNFLEAVSTSATAHYHTAASVPGDHVVGVKGAEISIKQWDRFSEGDTVKLDAGATFTILHADPKQHSDMNMSSIVLAVELGGARVLLVGDAESGPRKDPSYPAGDVEEFLLDHESKYLRADILQVGHHGSMTSSRHSFLAAVKPHLALVSSGPKRYGRVTLPDPEVIEELQHDGATILRTDAHDGDCTLIHRIGGDSGPGGCDSYIITIEPPKH